MIVPKSHVLAYYIFDEALKRCIDALMLYVTVNTFSVLLVLFLGLN